MKSLMISFMTSIVSILPLKNFRWTFSPDPLEALLEAPAVPLDVACDDEHPVSIHADRKIAAPRLKKLLVFLSFSLEL